MTAPKSLSAYRDCEEYFDRALERNGVLITCESPQHATRLQHKLNTYRSMLRRRNKQVYEDPGHPLHGASQFDHFQVAKDPEDPSKIRIQEYKTKVLAVEDLPQ